MKYFLLVEQKDKECKKTGNKSRARGGAPPAGG